MQISTTANNGVAEHWTSWATAKYNMKISSRLTFGLKVFPWNSYTGNSYRWRSGLVLLLDTMNTQLGLQ